MSGHDVQYILDSDSCTDFLNPSIQNAFKFQQTQTPRLVSELPVPVRRARPAADSFCLITSGANFRFPDEQRGNQLAYEFKFFIWSLLPNLFPYNNGPFTRLK